MKVKITSKGTLTSIEIDGVQVADHVTGFSLSQKAGGRPELILNVLPDEIIIDGDMIEVVQDENQ